MKSYLKNIKILYLNEEIYRTTSSVRFPSWFPFKFCSQMFSLYSLYIVRALNSLYSLQSSASTPFLKWYLLYVKHVTCIQSSSCYYIWDVCLVASSQRLDQTIKLYIQFMTYYTARTQHPKKYEKHEIWDAVETFQKMIMTIIMIRPTFRYVTKVQAISFVFPHNFPPHSVLKTLVFSFLYFALTVSDKMKFKTKISSV